MTLKGIFAKFCFLLLSWYPDHPGNEDEAVSGPGFTGQSFILEQLSSLPPLGD